MRPIIIIPPGQMSQEALKMLRDNGICVVVAKDPSRVKFFDPLPSMSSRTQMEDAAVKLSRCLLNWELNNCHSVDKKDVASLYVHFLSKGTPLDPSYKSDEQIRSQARLDELYRLGKEDARKEREARNKLQPKTPNQNETNPTQTTNQTPP